MCPHSEQMPERDARDELVPRSPEQLSHPAGPELTPFLTGSQVPLSRDLPDLGGLSVLLLFVSVGLQGWVRWHTHLACSTFPCLSSCEGWDSGCAAAGEAEDRVWTQWGRGVGLQVSGAQAESR